MSERGENWDDYWSDYGDSAERNPAQSMRRRLIMRELKRHTVSRVVDIGCGQGDLAAELCREFPKLELLGLEISTSGLAQSKAKVPSGTFVHANLAEPQSPPDNLVGWGDAATCSEVLEHVDDPAQFLRNALVYMRAGAPVVITVPAGPRSEFDLFIGHRRHFTIDSLRSTLEIAGLEVDAVSARGFPFFNLYRLLVILRGQRLVDDARETGRISNPSRALRALFFFFDVVLRIDIRSRRRGWQLLAVARVPN